MPETHDCEFFAQDASYMGYLPGGEIMLVYFLSLHICKNYHINAKYMINDINYIDNILILFKGCRSHDRMIVGLKLPMQSVPITTKVVSLNLANARCTQYNIM